MSTRPVIHLCTCFRGHGDCADLLIVCIPATRDTRFGIHTAPRQERGAGAAIAPGVRPRGGDEGGTESGRPNPVEITAAVERPFGFCGCLKKKFVRAQVKKLAKKPCRQRKFGIPTAAYKILGNTQDIHTVKILRYILGACLRLGWQLVTKA